MLVWRNKCGIKRNPMHARVKVAQTIFIALLSLALFFDQKGYAQGRSLISSMFFMIVNQTMMNLMGTLLTF
jgi:hypothetical protein